MPPAIESDRDEAFGKNIRAWFGRTRMRRFRHDRQCAFKTEFSRLLDIAVRFGFSRLEKEWHALNSDPLVEKRAIDRARPIVERCLRHMREGMQ